MNEREGNVPEVNVAKVPNANEASTPSGDIGNRTNQEVEPQLQTVYKSSIERSE